MVDLASAMNSGTGRVEYLWHVSGMPWAVCTSSSLAAQFFASDSATGEDSLAFGTETYDSGSEFFSSDVDVYPFLEIPGPQSIRNEDAMGKLDQGNWTVRIVDMPPDSSRWPHSARTTISGLEGLQSIASPLIDQSIKAARLYSPVGRADTEIQWSEDPGGRLATAAAAASVAAPLVVWVGLECMSITGATTASGITTATIGARGLLRTRAQYHATNKITAGAPSLLVADAPLFGVQNRPYRLYAYVVEDDASQPGGISIVARGLYRHGKVSSDVSFANGVWSVSCLPWWKWLDTELTVSKVESHAMGYILTRPMDFAYEVGSTFLTKKNAPPHVYFREYLASTTTMSDPVEIWLCNEGESVTYDDPEELCQDLAVAMTAASPNGWVYIYTARGFISPSLVTDDFGLYNGSIPWLFDIVDKERRGPYNAAANPNGFVSCPINAWNVNNYDEASHIARQTHNWPYETSVTAPMDNGPNYDTYDPDFPNSLGDWFGFDCDSSALGEYGKSPVIPRFVWQWGWEESDYAPFLSDTERYTKFYFPREQTSGEARLYIDPSYDLSNLGVGTVVDVGTRGPFCTGQAWATLVTESTSSGALLSNYIVIDDYDANHTTPDGNPALHSFLDEHIFIRGTALYGFAPLDGETYEPDAWQVVQSYEIRFPTIGDIYRSIMGTGTYSDDVAAEIQLDHIPLPETVDWDLLNLMVSSSGISSLVDITFTLRYSGAINLWTILLEELQFYGLTMGYQWSATDGQYVATFHKTNAISETMASLSGRSLTHSNIQQNTSSTAEHASAWQINAIQLYMNYDPDEKEFKFLYDIRDASGYEPTGGKINKLAIKPQITYVENIENDTSAQASLIAHFSQLMERLVYPRPAIKLKTTIADHMRMGICGEVLATVEDIHDPFFGTVGIDEWPCQISTSKIDLEKSECEYEVVMSSRRVYGWAPTVAIKTSSETTGTVTVTDIDYDGQGFCNSGSTTGWFDHWFFSDCRFNESMTAPSLVSSDQARCTLVERGSKTPSVITGVTCTYVNLLDYDTITGVSGTFLTLTGTTGYDDSKEWWLIFDGFDTAIADFQTKYIYFAETDLMLEPSSGDVPGRTWI